MIPEDHNASISPEYSRAINKFSVNLLDIVYSDTQFNRKNIVLSPFSVSRSLAILAEGASGKSKSELLEALGGQVALDDASDALSELLYADNSIILQCADAIWIDSVKYSINQSFKETAHKNYGVEYSGLDFRNTAKAVETINNWISANTNHYLKDILKPNDIKENTALFLTNAIYFKADWTSPFDITKTRPGIFHSPDGDIYVDMMSSNYHHKTRKTNEYENVKLFYGTQNTDFFYLDIYMPASGLMESFLEDSCLSALSNVDSLNFGGLIMPKFLFKTDANLIPVLEQLGIREIFNPNNQDLSGIVQCKTDSERVNIYVDMVRHVAGIETDEEGTKAYAVTVIRGGATSEAPYSPDVVLDRPFVYFIRAGKNGLILFAGVVNNPNTK